jgi:F1F0 ATPase subunit 2
MNEILIVALTLLAGLLLGGFFFGGLWWTVRRGVSSTRPALWFLGSLLVRMGTVLAGLYYIGHGDWRRLAACLFGFISARFFIMRRLRRPEQSRDIATKEAKHAP